MSRKESSMAKKNIEGLGGWLILVAIVVVFSPLRIIALLLTIYLELFTSGSWEGLTTPGTEVYNPLWVPILIGEISIHIALIIAWLFIAFLFFSKKKLFPKYYIGILLFTLAFILVDALAINTVLPEVPIFNADTTEEFVRSLIIALIWVPYMLVSKRVKLTFIK